MPDEDGPAAWPADRIQLAVQALVLRAHGYRCEEGVVYYQKTRQRVRLTFNDAAIAEAVVAISQAWATAAATEIPPPLVDSPKCPGCSLVGVCMPDETWFLHRESEDAPAEQLALFPETPIARPRRNGTGAARLLVAARVDRKPLYLNTQGLRVGKSGEVLQVKEKDKVVQQIRIGEVCQVNLLGNIQLSTQAVQTVCETETPICYFSQGGWFYGVTTGMGTKNVFLRKAPFRLADEDWYRLRIARRLGTAR